MSRAYDERWRHARAVANCAPPVPAKLQDEQTFIRFRQGIPRSRWCRTGLSARQVRAGSIAGNDLAPHRHLDDGPTAVAGGKAHAPRSKGRCTAVIDIGDPAGGITVDEFDEPRRHVAGVNGLETGIHAAITTPGRTAGTRRSPGSDRGIAVRSRQRTRPPMLPELVLIAATWSRGRAVGFGRCRRLRYRRCEIRRLCAPL